jgi:hypothetical protein
MEEECCPEFLSLAITSKLYGSPFFLLPLSGLLLSAFSKVQQVASPLSTFSPPRVLKWESTPRKCHGKVKDIYESKELWRGPESIYRKEGVLALSGDRKERNDVAL